MSAQPTLSQSSMDHTPFQTIERPLGVQIDQRLAAIIVLGARPSPRPTKCCNGVVMLKQLGPEIWTSDGPNVEVLGFQYPTRMAIIRLSNGDLFVWSPITFTETLRGAMDSLGRVKHIVAPNSLHYLSIPQWQKAYPDALVHATPQLRKKRKDISIDQDLERIPYSIWASEIDQV